MQRKGPDAATHIIDLYERNAAKWDRDRGRDLFERSWLEKFVALLPPCGAILDLGCGGGEPIAAFLMSLGRRVTGVDSSPSLIAICKARFPDSEWISADMRKLTLDRSFDGVIAWDSFFHLRPDDQRAMFAVFDRLCAKQGVLMFTSGPSFGEAVGSYNGEPLYHGSLDPAEYIFLLARWGFELCAHKIADPECGGHTVWLARRRQQTGLINPEG